MVFSFLLPSFGLRSACSALRLLVRRAINLGIGGGANRVGIRKWAFFEFFFQIFFDRLFASLLVLRSAHDGLGDLTAPLISLSVLHRLDRFLCHGFFLLLCSEIARTLERRNPQIFVVALVQLAMLANFIRPEPSSPLA